MRAQKYGIDCSRGVLNRGNLYRIERAMRKAMRGEAITVRIFGRFHHAGLSVLHS